MLSGGIESYFIFLKLTCKIQAQVSEEDAYKYSAP